MQLKDPDSAIAPVVGIAERYDPGLGAMHHHARAQIMYAVSGSMTVLTSRGSWVLPPSRALWLPANMRHALKASRAIELRTLYIDEGRIALSPRKEPMVIDVAPLLRELFLTMAAKPWDYGAGSANARLARVVCDQLAESAQQPLYLPDPLDPRARRLATMLYENPRNRRPLAVLAPLAGASVRTMDRLFMAETGMSVGMWVQQMRLMLALEIIAAGSGIGDAAFDVGFENPSSFIALFRKQFGVTPARYFR